MFSQNPGRGGSGGGEGEEGTSIGGGEAGGGARGIGGVVLVMTRGDIRAGGGGERRGLHSRHYLIWVVNDEREVGEGAEAFKAAFIGVVREDRTVIHLLFHEGKAVYLSSDGGDYLKGCSKALADVASQFLGCSCCGSPSDIPPGDVFFGIIGKDVGRGDGEGG